MKRKNKGSPIWPFLLVFAGSLLLLKPLLFPAKSRNTKNLTALLSQVVSPSRQPASISAAVVAQVGSARVRAPSGHRHRQAAATVFALTAARPILNSENGSGPLDFFSDGYNDDNSPYSSASEDEMLSEDDEFRSHSQEFDSVHRKTNAYLHNIGLDDSKIQLINQQSQAVRTEIRDISISIDPESPQAQQLVQAAMQKHYDWMAQELGPEIYSDMLKALQ